MTLTPRQRAAEAFWTVLFAPVDALFNVLDWLHKRRRR